MYAYINLLERSHKLDVAVARPPDKKKNNHARIMCGAFNSLINRHFVKRYRFNKKSNREVLHESTPHMPPTLRNDALEVETKDDEHALIDEQIAAQSQPPEESTDPRYNVSGMPGTESGEWQMNANEQPSKTDDLDPLQIKPDPDVPAEKTEPAYKQTLPKKQKDQAAPERSSKRIYEETRKRKIVLEQENEESDPTQVEDANYGIENEASPKRKKMRRLSHEFDIFGKFVSMQLKNMGETDAVLAQSEIQEVLIRYRLSRINSMYSEPEWDDEDDEDDVPSPVSQSGQPSSLSHRDGVSVTVEDVQVKYEPESESDYE